MHLTLRQLKIFAAAARHSSLTRAAEELHLTQPAVSMQVKQLEQSIGLPMFERVGRQLHLSEAGRELYRYCREILQKVAELAEVMDELRGLERGSLNIAVASTVGQYATHAVAEFHKLHRGVTVSLDVTNRRSLLDQLASNEADIVLMGFPPRDKRLEAIPFMDNPLVLIAAEDHPLRERKSVDLRQLASETFLMRESGSGTRLAIEKYLTQRRIKLQQTLFMSSNEAIKQSVEAGLGVAIVSQHTIQLELKARRVRVLPVRGFPLTRQWFVVHPVDKRLSAAARSFKEFVLSGRIKF